MTDNVYEVPHEHWVDELNAFTLLCEGWLVSIDVFGHDPGEALAIQRVPLVGVSADCLEHGGVVSISVARSAAGHFTHHVHGVRRIFVELAVDGTRAGLLIESGERARTVVELLATGRPHAASARLS
jgi:hypothetical protein